MKKSGLMIALVLWAATMPAWAAPQDSAQEAERADLIKKKQADADKVLAQLATAKGEAERKSRASEAQYQKALDRAAAVPVKAQLVSPLASLQATVKGTFWRDPEMVKSLDLSPAQQAKMDDVFQQYRLRLVDQTAALQKEEIILEPLFGATRPLPENESRILTQVDKIAEVRAELEKTNSRMLVGILQVLNAEQWNKLPGMPRTKFTVGRKF